MQSIPQNIAETRKVLSQMESMVQAMRQHEGMTVLHDEWFARLCAAWADTNGRAAAAALLVDGPLGRPTDVELSEAQVRQRALSCALLEAAIYEEVEFEQAAKDERDERGAKTGLPAPERVQAVLLDWLTLGAWRKQTNAPLTEIGRMVDRSSATPDDAIATRLGLLVSFWSSLVLWRIQFSALECKSATESAKESAAEVVSSCAPDAGSQTIQ